MRQTCHLVSEPGAANLGSHPLSTLTTTMVMIVATTMTMEMMTMIMIMTMTMRKENDVVREEHKARGDNKTTTL